MNILPETAKRLGEIKNICGIKEASGNISQILQYFNKGLDIAIYSGEDSLNALFMALGGSGVISVFSNAFPKLAKRIVRLGNGKQYEKMFILQSKCYNVINSLFLEVNPIPIKAGMSYLGLCCNELRLPLTPMTEANFETLKKHIDNAVVLEK